MSSRQYQDNDKPHQLSWLDYRDYRDRADVLQDLAAYVISSASLSADHRADRIAVNYVTGNYFSTLGVVPAHGRLIQPHEGEFAAADPVVVLGHRYWLRRFNGDPSVVGRTVLVNARPVTIVGVAPASFTGVVALVEFDAYLPFGTMPAAAFTQSPPIAPATT